MNLRSLLVMLVCVLATGYGAPVSGAPLGTAFTYQGQLVQGGNPVTSTADFQFTLWDALSAGIQVAGPTAVNNVSVNNGQFTASIDFGSIVFNGDARWLQIAVRSPAGSGIFTTLSPRQPLTAVPYALQTRGLFVDATGKVGVGTTAPAAGLHAVGNWNTEDGALRVSGDKAAIRMSSGPLGGNQSWMFHVGTDGPGNLGVYNRIAPNAWLNLMSLTPSGNLGLGTVAPLRPLHIVNPSAFAARFQSSSSVASVTEFTNTSSNTTWEYGVSGSTPPFGLPAGSMYLYKQGNSFPAFASYPGGNVATYGDHLFNNTSGVLVGAINPDPPPGSTTFPAGTPTMRAGSISMIGPAGRTRFGVWSRDTNFGGTWFPNQAHMFMDAADGNRVISIYTAGESGASGNIVCTNFLATGSKNFLVPNPDNPEEDITYACLEGPESGMYVRGTAEMINGRATVQLPTTFTSLASHEGLTVILTPLSGDSLGLACVNRSIHGFDVVELMKGEGNYEFDWEVKAIRRGTRDYKVVHPWTEHASGEGSESEVWGRRMSDIERRNAKFAQEEAELGPRPEKRPLPLVVAD